MVKNFKQGMEDVDILYKALILEYNSRTDVLFH